MKRVISRKNSIYRYALYSAILVLTACGGSSDPTPTPAPNPGSDNPVDTPVIGDTRRVISASDIDDSGNLHSTTEFRYDSRGRVSQEVQTLYTQSLITGEDEVEGVLTNTYQYDVIDRVERVISETVFADGSTTLDDTTITFENISSNNFRQIKSNNRTIDFVYSRERVESAKYTGGTGTESIDIDLQFTHNGNSAEITRVDKQYNTPTSVPFGTNYAEIIYQNGIASSLDESLNGRVLLEEDISVNTNNSIRTYKEITGQVHTVTYEYTEGDCLEQNKYAQLVYGLANVFSGLRVEQCR